MTTSLSARVAAHLRNVLRERRLSQDWLAGETGIALRTLGRRLALKHPTPFTLDELDSVADALGVSIHSLIDSAEAP